MIKEKDDEGCTCADCRIARIEELVANLHLLLDRLIEQRSRYFIRAGIK